MFGIHSILGDLGRALDLNLLIPKIVMKNLGTKHHQLSRHEYNLVINFPTNITINYGEATTMLPNQY